MGEMMEQLGYSAAGGTATRIDSHEGAAGLSRDDPQVQLAMDMLSALSPAQIAEMTAGTGLSIEQLQAMASDAGQHRRLAAVLTSWRQS
jgi:hypothetical protein